VCRKKPFVGFKGVKCLMWGAATDARNLSSMVTEAALDILCDGAETDQQHPTCLEVQLPGNLCSQIATPSAEAWCT
jgi:hypothetical protein